MVTDEAEQLHGAGRLKPIAILGSGIAMEHMFAVLQVEAGDSEGGDVGVDGGGAADELQHHVRGNVVAERGGETEEFLERDLDVRFWIFVLQRAVGLGKDAVAQEKMNGLIEGESSFFHEMKGSERERELEDGLQDIDIAGTKQTCPTQHRNSR